MLFSRQKYDPDDPAQLPPKLRQIPMPVTQLVPPSRRASRTSTAIRTTSGQSKMAAASAAITENWDPRAPRQPPRPLPRAPSRIASQIASEPAIGGVGLPVPRPGRRKSSAVRGATSMPIAPAGAPHTVYANLPHPPVDLPPDDTYLVPTVGAMPTAAARVDFLVPASTKTEANENIYEPLVTRTTTAARPSTENIYESLHHIPMPAATPEARVFPGPAPAAVASNATVTENIYETVPASASKTRWVGGTAYQALRRTATVDVPPSPPPLPPRPPPILKSSATNIPAGPSQLRASEPPLPQQSTIAVAGSVWPAKLNRAPPPPSPPPPEPPSTTSRCGPQPSAQYREKLKSVVARALQEQQRRRAQLSEDWNHAASASAAARDDALPSSAAQLASSAAPADVHQKAVGQKVAAALNMIERSRATGDVDDEPSTATATDSRSRAALPTRLPPPPPPSPPPPPLLPPPHLPSPVPTRGMGAKYPVPPLPSAVAHTGHRSQTDITQPPMVPALRKRNAPPPPPPTPATFLLRPPAAPTRSPFDQPTGHLAAPAPVGIAGHSARPFPDHRQQTPLASALRKKSPAPPPPRPLNQVGISHIDDIANVFSFNCLFST